MVGVGVWVWVCGRGGRRGGIRLACDVIGCTIKPRRSSPHEHKTNTPDSNDLRRVHSQFGDVGDTINGYTERAHDGANSSYPVLHLAFSACSVVHV